MKKRVIAVGAAALVAIGAGAAVFGSHIQELLSVARSATMDEETLQARTEENAQIEREMRERYAIPEMELNEDLNAALADGSITLEEAARQLLEASGGQTPVGGETGGETDSASGNAGNETGSETGSTGNTESGTGGSSETGNAGSGTGSGSETGSTGSGTGGGSETGNAGSGTGGSSETGNAGSGTGSGSETGNAGSGTGSGSETGNTGSGTGSGSETGNTGSGTGSGSEAGNTGSETGGGSETGNTGSGTGSGSETGSTGSGTGGGSETGNTGSGNGGGSETGNTGGGTGGAGSGTSGEQEAGPSEEERRLQNLIAQLYVLRSSFSGQIDSIISQCISEFLALDPSEQTTTNKIRIVSARLGEVADMERDCDNQVAAIVAQIREIDPSLADQAQSQYETEKEVKKASLIAQYT